MTNKIKIMIAAAVLLALVGVMRWWPEVVGPDPSVIGDATPAPELQVGLAEPTPASPGTASEPTRRRQVTAPRVATTETGNLLVRVRYGDDHQPAAGVGLQLRHLGGDHRIDVWRVRTDAAGTAMFEALQPGRFYLGCDRATRGKRAQVEAGETTELDFDLEVGLKITGIVVDAAGAPVGGALVEVAPLARADFDAEELATTGADGRFEVRGASAASLVGARAAGYASSKLQFLFGKPGNAAEVRIVLDKPGGEIVGRVVDVDGAPVRNAVIILGSGQTSAITAGRHGAPPIPALVRSDHQGLFRATGLPPGEQPVVARAAGCAPWQGTCHVVAHASRPLQITLAVGARLRGVVRDAAGRLVRGAEVEIGGWRDFAHYRTRSAADGSFSFTGLPSGELEVKGEHDDLGRATTRVRTVARADVTCEVRLSRGLELIGRVVDQAGDPVDKVILEFSGRKPGGKSWWAHARAEADGRFAVANCPEAIGLRVRARGRGIQTLSQDDIDPKAGELVLRVTRTLPPSVRIKGQVVGADGKPLANAMVSVSSKEKLDTPGIHSTGTDGGFEFGPLAPASWQVRVQAPGHPTHTTELRRLDAEATWEVGTIRLSRGGAAVIRVLGAQEPVSCRVYGVDEDMGYFVPHENPRRTAVLAPGDYRLLVRSKGMAARAVPFVIRAGADTRLDVELQPGTSQRLQLLLPPGVESNQGVVVRVLREGKVVQRSWLAVGEKRSIDSETWLAPGKYRVTASHGELRGSADFEIGRTAAQPVPVELRR